MATAIAPAEQIDQQLLKAHAEAEIALNKARNELLSEERTLAAATAQFNEQCKLQASGKKADPQAYRDSMTRIEQRIIGLKSIVADREAALNDVAIQRGEAARAKQFEAECQRFRGLQQQMNDARTARDAAQTALKQAEKAFARASNAFAAENLRWPTHLRQKAGF